MNVESDIRMSSTLLTSAVSHDYHTTVSREIVVYLSLTNLYRVSRDVTDP